MKKILSVLLLVLVSTSAFAETITCNVQVSLEEVARVEFDLAPNTQTKYVASEGFSFYLNNKGDSKFELEIFNIDGPSRSYAEGYLRSPNDTLTWTLWTRDILLATECKLANK
ncbi:MAG: hypothetical protein K2Q18_00155 [Bdellovibrionales bacterium]|nr:hypothetical protein [Bdellovibrionales bacterium]